MSDREAFRAEVFGRVQGVGFRYSTVHAAARSGVTGWVRNRLDGSVEVFAQGPPGPLQTFREWLHQGPRAARVDTVTVAPAPTDPSLTGFTVR
jgi:acylphosphatase